MTSASIAKLAVTPPMVGIGQHGNVEKARVAVALDRAAGLRHLHQRDKMPSCIRAPPETVTADHRQARVPARIQTVRVIFSPTAVPMLPIMKYGSIRNRAQAHWPLMRPVAADNGLRLFARTVRGHVSIFSA